MCIEQGRLCRRLAVKMNGQNERLHQRIDYLIFGYIQRRGYKKTSEALAADSAALADENRRVRCGDQVMISVNDRVHDKTLEDIMQMFISDGRFEIPREFHEFGEELRQLTNKYTSLTSFPNVSCSENQMRLYGRASYSKSDQNNRRNLPNTYASYAIQGETVQGILPLPELPNRLNQNPFVQQQREASPMQQDAPLTTLPFHVAHQTKRLPQFEQQHAYQPQQNVQMQPATFYESTQSVEGVSKTNENRADVMGSSARRKLHVPQNLNQVMQDTVIMPIVDVINEGAQNWESQGQAVIINDNWDTIMDGLEVIDSHFLATMDYGIEEYVTETIEKPNECPSQVQPMQDTTCQMNTQKEALTSSVEDGQLRTAESDSLATMFEPAKEVFVEVQQTILGVVEPKNEPPKVKVADLSQKCFNRNHTKTLGDVERRPSGSATFSTVHGEEENSREKSVRRDDDEKSDASHAARRRENGSYSYRSSDRRSKGDQKGLYDRKERGTSSSKNAQESSRYSRRSNSPSGRGKDDERRYESQQRKNSDESSTGKGTKRQLEESCDESTKKKDSTRKHGTEKVIRDKGDRLERTSSSSLDRPQNMEQANKPKSKNSSTSLNKDDDVKRAKRSPAAHSPSPIVESETSFKATKKHVLWNRLQHAQKNKGDYGNLVFDPMAKFDSELDNLHKKVVDPDEVVKQCIQRKPLNVNTIRIPKKTPAPPPVEPMLTPPRLSFLSGSGPLLPSHISSTPLDMDSSTTSKNVSFGADRPNSTDFIEPIPSIPRIGTILVRAGEMSDKGSDKESDVAAEESYGMPIRSESTSVNRAPKVVRYAPQKTMSETSSRNEGGGLGLLQSPRRTTESNSSPDSECSANAAPKRRKLDVSKIKTVVDSIHGPANRREPF